MTLVTEFNPLNPELNPICYLLALLGAHHFLRVSRIRVKLLTFRLLMSYISLGRPRRRWEDNIKMDLQEVGVGRGNWMELAQDRDRWRALVGTVRDFQVS